MTIFPINKKFQEQVNEQIKEHWGGPLIVTKGTLIDTSQSPGFVATDCDDLLGYITYQITNDECEITTLNSLRERQGVGSALIHAVIDLAKEERCKRVWLITTNDNTYAIRFYQRLGFSLVEVHKNALNHSRELKPSIPMTGIDNIPLLHEFEFELCLLQDEC